MRELGRFLPLQLLYFLRMLLLVRVDVLDVLLVSRVSGRNLNLYLQVNLLLLVVQADELRIALLQKRLVLLLSLLQLLCCFFKLALCDAVVVCFEGQFSLNISFRRQNSVYLLEAAE